MERRKSERNKRIVVEVEPFVNDVKSEPENIKPELETEEESFNKVHENTYDEGKFDDAVSNHGNSPSVDIKPEPGDMDELENSGRDDEDSACEEEEDWKGDSDNKSEHSRDTSASTSSQGKMIFIEVPAVDNYINCEICGDLFSKSSGSKKSRKKKNKCEKCAKARNSRRKKPELDANGHVIIRKYVKQPIPDTPPQHECNICHKKFHKAISVTKHMVIHTDPNKYVCEVCFKGFNQIGNMMRHRMTHNEEKIFSCKICPKAFTQIAYLRKHEHVHTGDRPHTCHVCDKRFSDYSTLAKHRMIHTGLRPYNCVVCLKTFNQLSSLKRHQLVHTKEKNYPCSICSKKFSRSDRLKRHQTIHFNKPSVLDAAVEPFADNSQIQTTF